MTTFTMGEAKENPDGEKTFDSIPENTVLLAELIDCSVVDSPWKDDKTGEVKKQVSFKWRVIEEGDYEGRQVFGNTSTAFVNHPDCKLRAWVLEILGQDDLPVGFSFETDMLVGAIAKIGVTEYPSNKRDAKGEPIKRNKVGWVLRAGDDDFVQASEAF